MNADLTRRYQALVNNSSYSHFTRIPERIVRFLYRLQIKFNRQTVYERLLSHYLFIAVVDDAIDSGEDGVERIVFDRFSAVAGNLNEVSDASDITIVTEVLKSHVEDVNRVPMLRSLQRAHHEVLCERTATSIGTYMKHRKALGRATARQSYLLLRSALSAPNPQLCRLMEEIAAVGCLVDSLIDVGDDQRSGLINFDLTVVDYARLCFSTAIAGFRVWTRRPSLTLLLAEAVLDIFRDRGRARSCAIPQAGSLSQPIAQSFRDSVAHRL